MPSRNIFPTTIYEDVWENFEDKSADLIELIKPHIQLWGFFITKIE